MFKSTQRQTRFLFLKQNHTLFRAGLHRLVQSFSQPVTSSSMSTSRPEGLQNVLLSSARGPEERTEHPERSSNLHKA